MHSRTIVSLIAISSLVALAACVSDSSPAKGDSDAGAPDGATAVDSGGGSHPVLPGTDASTGNDAGQGTDAADAAPPFSPKSLAGLALWLDSDSASMTQSQGKVVGWADKSGKSSNATNQLPTTSPTLTTANAKFNGRPTVHFDGSQYLYVLHNANLQFGNGDFLMAAVVSVPSGAHGLETLFSKRDTAMGNSPGPALYLNSAGGATAFTAIFGGIDSTTKGLDNGSAHYIAARRTGTTLVVETDGTTAMTTIQPLATTTGDGIDLQIGVETVSGFQSYLTGDLGEAVIVLGTVSAGDDASLHQYMATKYGL